MRRTLLQFFHQMEDEVPADKGNCKECQRLQSDNPDVVGRILHTHDSSQDQDADDIVNDRGAHDRRADCRVQLAKLLERLNRNRNRGCREDRPDKESLHKLFASGSCKPIEAHVQNGSGENRNRHACKCNQRRLQPGFLQFLHIGLKSC